MSSQHDLQVYISVDEPYSGLVPDGSPDDSPEPECLEQGWLERVARAALAVAWDLTSPAQMSLLITNDATVRSLNAQFRGTDEVTDVLSFSAEHGGHWQGEDEGPEEPVGVPFVLPPDEPEPLGEVIVSFPQTKRQAEEHGVALEHELAYLVVHGVLHLSGHDHLEPEETSLMQSKERTALEALGISLKLPSDGPPDGPVESEGPVESSVSAESMEVKQA